MASVRLMGVERMIFDLIFVDQALILKIMELSLSEVQVVSLTRVMNHYNRATRLV
jgi:hypothetical protein